MKTSSEIDNEFLLRHGSGDEWFDVLDDDESIRCSGEEVSIRRGDRVRVSFNALSQSAKEEGEHGRRFALEGFLSIDQDGNLVMPNGVRHKVGRIVLSARNGNSMLFDRTKK